MSPDTLILLGAAFFFIALMYSSVGFGGGSSYLALLSLVLGEFYVIRTLALLCNLTVVTGSSWLYFRKGLLNIRSALPLVLSSIPMAFLGASFRLQENQFFVLLGLALLISSFALAWQSLREQEIRLTVKKFPYWMNFLLGGGIGLLSGLVGIGGGIFLSPILNHLRWDIPVRIAALASFFIWVNSLSGLFGLYTQGTFQWNWTEGLVLLLCVLLGGQLGSRLSANKLTGKTIKLLTALLVFVVSIRILIRHLPNLLTV